MVWHYFSDTRRPTSKSANPYLAVIGPICFVYRIDIVLPIGIQLGQYIVGYRSFQYQTIITLVPSLLDQITLCIRHITCFIKAPTGETKGFLLVRPSVCLSVCLSVRPIMFSAFIFYTWFKVNQWKLAYSLSISSYRSSSTYVPVDTFLQELGPLVRNSVFRTFLSNASLNFIETWQIALIWIVTGQVWYSFRLIHFCKSYGPFLCRKFSFWSEI